MAKVNSEEAIKKLADIKRKASVLDDITTTLFSRLERESGTRITNTDRAIYDIILSYYTRKDFNRAGELAFLYVSARYQMLEVTKPPIGFRKEDE